MILKFKIKMSVTDIKLEGQANPNLCIEEYFVASYKYVLEVWINMNISDVLLDSLPHSLQRKALPLLS